MTNMKQKWRTYKEETKSRTFERPGGTWLEGWRGGSAQNNVHKKEGDFSMRDLYPVRDQNDEFYTQSSIQIWEHLEINLNTSPTV